MKQILLIKQKKFDNKILINSSKHASMAFQKNIPRTKYFTFLWNTDNTDETDFTDIEAGNDF